MTPVSRRHFLALSGAAAARAAFGRTTPSGNKPLTTLADLTAGNTAFACDLYGQIRKTPGNLFFSPFSISTALAMTAAGARGATRDEMGRVLHLPDDPDAAFGELTGKLGGGPAAGERPYQLSTANAVWAQKGYPWRAEYKALVQKNYGAGLFDVEFAAPDAARQTINAWVEKETRDKIRDLIPAGALTPLTRMVLTNAIYFKGAWAAPFEKSRTTDQPFTPADGPAVAVPLMTRTGTFGYGEVLTPGRKRVQVLELPYAGRDLSMVVLLPDAAAGPGDVEADLSPGTLAGWAKETHPRRVEVFLPRFKVETAVGLKPTLETLGMKAAFDDRTADFGGMHTGGEKLSISAVLHKAFVDVNEAGTEAAAATGVVVGVRSAPAGRPPTFRADRPFLFLIREDKTGAVLFAGRVANPKG